jgi:hypothetical protein
MALEENAERAKKLRALEKSTIKRNAWFGFRTCFLLFLTNVLVIAYDALEVHSQAFIFFGSAINAFFLFRWMGRDMRSERDRVNAEVKKIFEQ